VARSVRAGLLLFQRSFRAFGTLPGVPLNFAQNRPDLSPSLVPVDLAPVGPSHGGGNELDCTLVQAARHR
jgi:hypothetical protein